MSTEEMRQYEEQYQHIEEILRIYEETPEDFGKLFNALQQVRLDE